MTADSTFESSTGIFPTTQPLYAAHGIPTFPVDSKKKPMVRSYDRIGHRYSGELARNPKFANVDGVGFVTGRSSRVTIIDIDSTSDRELAHSLDRHGRTPLIARTPSGGHHLYYRHGGERRQIRPWPGLPVDVLGAGLAVLPPSISRKGRYEFIEGTIADFDRLPPIQFKPEIRPEIISAASTKRGTRNRDLFRHCMRSARHCDTLDDLLDVARTFNDEMFEPLGDDEVCKVVTSAWRYEETGQNHFGQHGAFVAANEALQLISTNQDLLVLLMYLRANNAPDRIFFIPNNLSEVFHWRRKRLVAAREALIRDGYIRRIRAATSNGRAAEYCWLPRPRHREGTGGDKV
jgi:hypothetical protein